MSNDETTTATPHLWEVEHPYRCEDANYMGKSKSWGDVDLTWAEFVEQGNPDWDPELNLVFRWDWECADAYRKENDGDSPWWCGEVYGDRLTLNVEPERSVVALSLQHDVQKSDEPAVRKFLTESWAAMLELWTPFAPGAS